MNIKIKICGITSEPDAHLAVECRCDFVGFIFAVESKRCIALEDCKHIIANIPDEIKKVGVFVNESVENIRYTAEECSLDIVQLHGEEPEQTVETLSPLLTVWKKVTLREEADVERAQAIPVDAVLTDTRTEAARGGTGQTGDWGLSAQLASMRRVVLAGGLNPENVAQAVRTVQPFAVDLNSGVETYPGKKDPDKLRDACDKLQQWR